MSGTCCASATTSRCTAEHPRINVIRNFDIHNGPVPYGAPTNADLLAVTTPPEFRTPAVISFPVFGWTWKGR